MLFILSYLTGFAAVLILMTLLWLLSLIVKDAGIVDIFWGMGFVILAGLFFALTDGLLARKLLLLTLVTLWGLRLSLHLAYRNIGKPEDFRYANWRTQAGRSWWWQSYLRVFLLQGFIMWIVAAPLLGAQLGFASFSLLDMLAILLWLFGFIFETIGDWQLQRFKANPSNRGKVLNTGLWRYTRHPNYFGDAVQWWAFYLIALSAGFWWTIFSPILMTFLLVRVSGVAMLERTLKNKPQYAEYIRTTSAFFPRPPLR